jgi:hypothetical protein
LGIKGLVVVVVVAVVNIHPDSGAVFNFAYVVLT